MLPKEALLMVPFDFETDAQPVRQTIPSPADVNAMNRRIFFIIGFGLPLAMISPRPMFAKKMFVEQIWMAWAWFLG
jgi:hypothetical protein